MERYYPFEHRKEKEINEQQEAEKEVREAPVQARGRRDGNSASSIVIHSGRVTERARKIAERGAGQAGPGEDPGKGYSKGYAKGYGKSYRNDYGKNKENGFRKDVTRDKSHGNRKPDPSERFDAANDLRGKRLCLKVQENTAFGSFLEIEEGKKILLPFSEQTGRPEPGDMVEVTVYEDKGGRLTATMKKPLVGAGSTGVLTVAAVTKIGAFADNGMPKQVLIPFREMLHTPEVGDQVLVYIYHDKSGREAGTMRVYRHLETGGGYQPDDRAEGFVYEINPKLGVFVAVDDRYYGMIPAGEVFETLHYGDRVLTRVSKVREDGKLDLLLREKLYTAADKDADRILKAIMEQDGVLPYADKADAETIRRDFSMSKNQFKRALGYLYKKRLIEIDRESDTVRFCGQQKKEER